MSASIEPVWNHAAVRSAVRLLGSHPPDIADPQATARVLRLVWDIVQRRGAPTEIFQLPGVMPLVLIGNGPILVMTHLDDPHPSAQGAPSEPPSIVGDNVAAPGITRMAGVLAVLGSVLSNESTLEMTTVVVEADRHRGSIAVQRWLQDNAHRFGAALCEVSDLPVPAPALYRSTTGVVTIEITLRVEGGAVESFYGGVQPDTGHRLITTLSSLKSEDAEVLIPGFYDSVTTPDTVGLNALQSVAASVGAWLTRGVVPADDRLSSNHLTLGAFLAPSIVIRGLRLDDTGPYLVREASAMIEARLMPGQEPATIEGAIREAILQRLPDALLDPVLVVPPAVGGLLDVIEVHPELQRLPVAPGNSPAGALEHAGIPTLGFSTVWRDPSLFEEQVSITSIVDGSSFVASIAHAAHATRNSIGQSGR